MLRMGHRIYLILYGLQRRIHAVTDSLNVVWQHKFNIGWISLLFSYPSLSYRASMAFLLKIQWAFASPASKLGHKCCMSSSLVLWALSMKSSIQSGSMPSVLLASLIWDAAPWAIRLRLSAWRKSCRYRAIINRLSSSGKSDNSICCSAFSYTSVSLFSARLLHPVEIPGRSLLRATIIQLSYLSASSTVCKASLMIYTEPLPKS